MSTNSYAWSSDIMRMYPMIMQTANVTPDALEIYGDMADGDINAACSRRYTMPLNTSSMYPIEPLRTIARKKWAYNFLRSRIMQEDPSRSGWVDKLNQEADDALKQIADGKVSLVALADTTAAFTIAEKGDNRSGFWSSTAAYRPTMDLRHAEAQRVDPDRLAAMNDAGD